MYYSKEVEHAILNGRIRDLQRNGRYYYMRYLGTINTILDHDILGINVPNIEALRSERNHFKKKNLKIRKKIRKNLKRVFKLYE